MAAAFEELVRDFASSIDMSSRSSIVHHLTSAGMTKTPRDVRGSLIALNTEFLGLPADITSILEHAEPGETLLVGFRSLTLTTVSLKQISTYFKGAVVKRSEKGGFWVSAKTEATEVNFLADLPYSETFPVSGIIFRKL